MYQSFYKLTAKPFQLSPDARFFYSSQGHKRALSYLLYGVQQGEGFIIVTGDVGTGKTTLVGALSNALKDNNVVTAKIVSTQVQEEDLLRVVAAEYGLPYKDVPKGILLRQLETFFLQTHSQGKHALLIVDEAQNLPPRTIEELRMLSNFQKEHKALLQTFLLGQREFRDIMRSEGFEQLRQRVIAAYHLRPLEVEEVEEYIKYRLRAAGWNNDPVLADDIYEDIYRFTNGVPRRINVFFDRLLVFGCLEEKHEIDSLAVASVISDMQDEELGIMDRGDAVEPEPNLLHSSASPSSATDDLLKQPESHASDRRLAVLESTLLTMGTSFQQELSMLREALVESEKVKKPRKRTARKRVTRKKAGSGNASQTESKNNSEPDNDQESGSGELALVDNQAKESAGNDQV